MKIQHVNASTIRKRLFLVVVILVSGILVVNAQTTYPYNFAYDGNPLVRNHGAADPDVHVWDGTVWMYCSQDHDGGYSNMDGYHAFSSTDMINWTDHGDVFNSSMLDESRWGSTPDHWMWAPGAARKQDENGVWTYYLYYPHNVKFGGEDWVTGVATAQTPAGPFTDQGPLRGGKIAMDPMVFIDDDGEAYIYANNLKVAKLKPNMIELAESPRSIKYDINNEITDPLNEEFGEGSYMHKRDGVYYYSYSNFHGNDYQGFYAVGDNPYGPFDWEGPMAPNPAGAQDHHSVIEFQGQWYYFYHIAVSSYPKIKDGQSRIACYDRLYYNNDGSIQPVVHTYGPTNLLTMSAANGTVFFDPQGRSYRPSTKVKLTATGDLGYAFSAWGGDLSGSNNPTTITMDMDKNVTASFVSVPIYELTTNATNGSIVLAPPGGVYSAGTVVTLTPVDDFGFNFSSWSGDLTGSQSPATITMDSDKSVTANFTQVPTYTITANTTNGSIELDPAGGVYEAGTDVTVKAFPDFGYKFSGWSGDISGMVNPVTITMDSDKNIRAAFSYVGGGAVVFATNCGGSAYKSDDGVNFSADTNFNGGGTYKTGDAISRTTDDVLYQSERFGGTFGYIIPLPNGDYEVTLMFAEIFHSSAGSRVFNVEIEGDEILNDFDIWSKAGKNTAYNETISVSISDGTLNISFSTIKDNAKISAIKVVKLDDHTGINQRQAPMQIQLCQNFPNPFNPETTIPYQLTESSPVKLVIHNFLGQHVITLVDEQQAAGYHTAAWNGNDTNGKPMASGIYFYQLATNINSILTKKFILTK